MKRATAEKAMLPITLMPRNIRAVKIVSVNGLVKSFLGIV
jgi:hypothetical protein